MPVERVIPPELLKVIDGGDGFLKSVIAKCMEVSLQEGVYNARYAKKEETELFTYPSHTKQVGKQVSISVKRGVIKASNPALLEEAFKKLEACAETNAGYTPISPPPAEEDYAAPPPPPTTGCTAVLTKHNITDISSFNKWARNGGHPDKGGDKTEFQNVSDCVDRTFKGKTGGKTRKTRKGKKRTRKMSRRPSKKTG